MNTLYIANKIVFEHPPLHLIIILKLAWRVNQPLRNPITVYFCPIMLLLLLPDLYKTGSKQGFYLLMHICHHTVRVPNLLEVKLPYDPSCPSDMTTVGRLVDWSVGWSVCCRVDSLSLFTLHFPCSYRRLEATSAQNFVHPSLRHLNIYKTYLFPNSSTYYDGPVIALCFTKNSLYIYDNLGIYLVNEPSTLYLHVVLLLQFLI